MFDQRTKEMITFDHVIIRDIHGKVSQCHMSHFTSLVTSLVSRIVGIIFKVTLLLKTSSQNILVLESLIEENHPYDTPCIMFLPLTSVHFPFLSWALEQTTTASP